jgi:peptidyl-dipeptidase A
MIFSQYNRLINDMLAIYNAATICAYNDPFRCGLHLYPGNVSLCYNAKFR